MKLTKKESRILGLASLALVLMYFFPIWTIDLEAPQYPEGIGLEIMIDTVQGQKKHDLTNINNLNHYIGMKRIEPDSITELKIMPYLIGFLIVFGLVAAASRKRWMLVAWTVTFFVLAVVGLVDFYLWEYDYGHNLDNETAAIKIPGMSYQPPLIGSKQLLNFTAHSWPGIGGWIAFASLATGMWLTVSGFRRKRKQTAPAVAAAALLVLFTGCSNGPKEIHFGEDQGAFCRMTISDARFAAQIVTDKGKAYNFNSIECLLGYIESGAIAEADIARMWVSDYANPGTLIAAEQATFLRSADIHSPMSGGLAAFANSADAEAMLATVQGDMLGWQTLSEDTVATLH